MGLIHGVYEITFGGSLAFIVDYLTHVLNSVIWSELLLGRMNFISSSKLFCRFCTLTVEWAYLVIHPYVLSNLINILQPNSGVNNWSSLRLLNYLYAESIALKLGHGVPVLSECLLRVAQPIGVGTVRCSSQRLPGFQFVLGAAVINTAIIVTWWIYIWFEVQLWKFIFCRGMILFLNRRSDFRLNFVVSKNVFNKDFVLNRMVDLWSCSWMPGERPLIRLCQLLIVYHHFICQIWIQIYRLLRIWICSWFYLLHFLNFDNFFEFISICLVFNESVTKVLSIRYSALI